MNRPCRWPGCPAIVARGVGYCTAHQAKGQGAEADRTRQYDAGRDPRAVAFYRSAAWLRMRATVLAEQPVCADCRTRLSHHVDHVIPLADDWARRLDRDNLQGLCQSCHAAKTGAERAVGRRLGPRTAIGTAEGYRTPQRGVCGASGGDAAILAQMPDFWANTTG